MNFIKAIQSHWRLILILGLTCAAITYLYTHYALVQITITTKDGITGTPSLSFSTEKETSPLRTLSGMAIIPRDAGVITATISPYSGSVYGAQSPVFSTKHITLLKDKNAEKYSRSQGVTAACSSYKKESDTLTSFDCKESKDLYTFKKTSPATFAQVRTGLTPGTEQPASFKGGVLGLTTLDSNEPLFYTTPNGETSYYPLPDDIEEAKERHLTIVTSSDMDSNSFVLVSARGNVYVGNIQSNKVHYATYKHPDGFDAANDVVFCSMSAQTVNCYFGKSASAKTTNLAPQLVSIKITNQNKLNFLVYSTDKIYPDKMLTAQENVFFTQDNNLYALRVTGAAAKKQLVAHGIMSAGAGENLFYVKQDAIFKVDTNTQSAHLVFQSSHLSIVGVTPFGSEVFFNARIKDQGDEIHKYKLTADMHTTTVRPIDIIPLRNNNLPISNMELYKDQLLVRVKIPIDKQAKSAASAINQVEYTKIKEEVTDYLQEKGISPDMLTITYSY